MAASLVITCKTTETAVAALAGSSSADQETLRGLVNYLEKCAAGCENASIDVQYSTTAPVAASGTLTLVSVPADDTVIIGAVTLTAKASPSGENQFSQAGSDAVDAAALAAKINAHSILSKVVVATALSNVVTVTALVKGEIGNQIALAETGTSITASGAFLAGGTGGATSAASTLSMGL